MYHFRHVHSKLGEGFCRYQGVGANISFFFLEIAFDGTQMG